MIIYLAGTDCRNSSQENINETMEIKNHLESYFYIKNKPNFIKELKSENSEK